MEAEHTVSGFPVPDIITQEVDKLKSFPLHPDDVWVVAYPKAGSTWTQQIVRLVRNGGQDDGKQVLSVSVPWLEALSRMYPNVKVEELPTPRTFQSHFKYDNMPCGLPSTTLAMWPGTPKDLAVSYYHHHRGFK